MIPDIINDSLDAIVAKLPKKAQRYAKALVPALATAVAALVTALINGTLDSPTLKTILVTGFGGALLTLLLPNRDPDIDDHVPTTETQGVGPAQEVGT